MQRGKNAWPKLQGWKTVEKACVWTDKCTAVYGQQTLKDCNLYNSMLLELF